jgi:hypothetical protein
MPIDIRGKTYFTVSERIESAHGDTIPVGIQSIETELATIDGVTVARATATFVDGRHFQGTASANMAATSGVDASVPLENAETSAVGRALAFAGYPGSPSGGIAGAEEMMEAQRRAPSASPSPSPSPTPSPTPSATPSPTSSPTTPSARGDAATGAQVSFIQDLLAVTGADPNNYPHSTKAEASESIEKLKAMPRKADDGGSF